MSIERISLRLAKALCKATDRESDLEYIRYAFEIIIGALLTTASLYGLASILGVMKECLIVSITFAVFRAFMGGYHFSHFYQCFVVTVGGFNLFAWISRSLPAADGTLTFISIAVLIGLIVWMAIKFVPVNAYYRANTEQQRNRFRKITLALVGIWSLLLLIAIHMDWTSVVIPLYFGLGLQAVTIPLELVKMRKEITNEHKI
jgi:accessory gene regulator B